jgi:hypothetical protein
METSHVRDTDPLLLDPSMDEYYLPDENIYLGKNLEFRSLSAAIYLTAIIISGILAEESMAASDLSAQQKREIRVNCRKFYITAINQFQARFDFSDPYFDLCKIVKPEVARKANPKLISCLFQRFPILKKSVRESVAQQEWRQAALLKTECFNAENEKDVTDMPVEAYWKIVLNAEKNSKKMYPNLAICMQLLLSMPCSNASSERAFSVMKNIKTAKRNGLHNLTVSSLMRIKNWLKTQSFTAGTAVINKDIMAAVKEVKANVQINVYTE